jgi:hypothetical protein
MTASCFDGRLASASGSGSGKGLDRRPQLIDQPVAVADFPPLFDTRKSIPQCQQPLAAERRGVQFLDRRDDNLALIDCGRRSLRRPKPVYSGLILWRCWEANLFKAALVEHRLLASTITREDTLVPLAVPFDAAATSSPAIAARKSLDRSPLRSLIPLIKPKIQRPHLAQPRKLWLFEARSRRKQRKTAGNNSETTANPASANSK